MTDHEQVKVYADLLWWFLLLLAAWGIPSVIGGIVGMIINMGTMSRGPKWPPPPPTFEEWQELRKKSGGPNP